MAYIFYMSHQAGVASSNASSSVTNVFLQFLPLSANHAYMLETIIRKLAHILEYALLTWLLFLSIKPYIKQSYCFAFIGSAIYAITDEIHQYFIPGRTALATDVMIDSIGIIIITLTISYFYYKKRNSA